MKSSPDQAEQSKNAASRKRMTIAQSRKGRRPMSVSTLLRKEKEGTMYKQTELGEKKAGLGTNSAGYKLQGKTEVQGIPVDIENRKGSIRKGRNEDGSAWRTKFKVPYGYIRGTKGADGEEIDTYVGPNKDSDRVFVVHQKDDKGRYDEDTVMLGFKSKADAKKTIRAHYDDPKYIGNIMTVAMDRFQEMLSKKNKKLTKISMKDDDKKSQIVNALLRMSGAAGLAGGGYLAAEEGAERALGATRFAHGTGPDTAKKIREVGLDPRFGGGPSGASSAVENPNFIRDSKNRIHVTTGNDRRGIAGQYAAMGEVWEKAKSLGKKPDHKELMNAYLGMGRKEGIVEGAIPAEKLQKFEIDPEYGKQPHYQALRGKEKIDPKYISKGRAGFRAIVRGRAKNLPKYVSSNPKRALSGVGLGVGGPLVAGIGISQLAKPFFDKEASSNALIEELDALEIFTPDCLSKIAEEISAAQALEAMGRLRTLEKKKPSLGEVGRGAAVGATVIPLAGAVSDIISPRALSSAAPPRIKALARLGRGARTILGRAGSGAVTGSLLPVGRHHLERESEKQKLRQFVGQEPKKGLGRVRGRVRGYLGV